MNREVPVNPAESEQRKQTNDKKSDLFDDHTFPERRVSQSQRSLRN